MKEKKIKVVMLESGKEAYVTELDNSLKSMQQIVGGLIEAVYPFEEEVCIICSDEGKLIGMPLNRALYDDEGNVFDIIAGTAFICGCKGEHFGSLSNEQAKRYCKQFRYPEWFAMIDGKLAVFPIC